MENYLTIDLVRVTEQAAIAAARWVGRGDKNKADQAATVAMRRVFDTLPIEGTVVIGEGEMDEAPMLYIGERLGLGGPEVDVAVDPLEGTNLVSKGLGDAIAVVGAAPKGSLLHAPDMYMDKIAVGPKATGAIDLLAPVQDNLTSVARKLGKDVSDLVVVLLDRARHLNLIEQIRAMGARVKLIPDGDVAVAIQAGNMDIDLLLGSGGAPEGVLAAAALKCMGGEIQGRLLPEDQAQYDRCVQMGMKDPKRVLHMEDLVKGDDAIFAATGITDGEVLGGVLQDEDSFSTHSVVMRAKTKEIRYIEAFHPRVSLVDEAAEEISKEVRK